MKCIVIVDSPEVKEERGKVSRNVRHRQGREAAQSHEIDFSRSHMVRVQPTRPSLCIKGRGVTRRLQALVQCLTCLRSRIRWTMRLVGTSTCFVVGYCS